MLGAMAACVRSPARDQRRLDAFLPLDTHALLDDPALAASAYRADAAASIAQPAAATAAA
jgi:hypothetical protein